MSPLMQLVAYWAICSLLFCVICRTVRGRVIWGSIALALCAVFAGCASLKPQIEVARHDFEQACHSLTQAMVGDAHPDQAEVIAQKVCYAEQVTVRVEQEIVAAQKQLFQSQPPPALLLDAGP